MMQDDHLPPNMQQTEQHKLPFTLSEQTIKQAGLHALTPAQQKRAVLVYDLSDDISVKQLSEFFGYCGGVDKIVLNHNQGGYLFSVVVLESDAAFATAVLLNHAILNDVSITVAPYTDFVKSSGSSSSSSSSSNNNNNRSSSANLQSYLQQLQDKKTAYEKVISLMSMGYVKSQEAIGSLQNKVSDLDEQTKDVREQISTTTQPVVQTTKMTLDAANQKIQPVLNATKEKLDPYTTTVNNFAKEQYEKFNQSEIWENDTVKQVTFVSKAAKDEIANATKNAWNAVKASWLSLKLDVEAESSTLRGDTKASSSDRVHTPPVPQHLLDQKQHQNEQTNVDDYFAEQQSSSSGGGDILQFDSSESPDQSHLPPDMQDSSHSNNNHHHHHHHKVISLGNDEGDEYGLDSPNTPNSNEDNNNSTRNDEDELIKF